LGKRDFGTRCDESYGELLIREWGGKERRGEEGGIMIPTVVIAITYRQTPLIILRYNES